MNEKFVRIFLYVICFNGCQSGSLLLAGVDVPEPGREAGSFVYFLTFEDELLTIKIRRDT